MDYGRAIRVVRNAYGLTQNELAARLSVGPSQLSLVESGKRQPSLRLLDEISSALQVPPHLLTLLASNPDDIEDPKNAPQISALATALLKLLVSAGRQPSLPIKRTRSRRRSA